MEENHNQNKVRAVFSKHTMMKTDWLTQTFIYCCFQIHRWLQQKKMNQTKDEREKKVKTTGRVKHVTAIKKDSHKQTSGRKSDERKTVEKKEAKKRKGKEKSAAERLWNLHPSKKPNEHAIKISRKTSANKETKRKQESRNKYG